MKKLISSLGIVAAAILVQSEARAQGPVATQTNGTICDTAVGSEAVRIERTSQGTRNMSTTAEVNVWCPIPTSAYADQTYVMVNVLDRGATTRVSVAMFILDELANPMYSASKKTPSANPFGQYVGFPIPSEYNYWSNIVAKVTLPRKSTTGYSGVAIVQTSGDGHY